MTDGEYLVGDPLHPPITLIPKEDIPHYLAWIRERPCVITGKFGCEANHIIFRSKGNAALDIFALPFRPELHREYHAIGHKNFEAKYRIDLRDPIVAHILRYIKTHP